MKVKLKTSGGKYDVEIMNDFDVTFNVKEGTAQPIILDLKFVDKLKDMYMGKFVNALMDNTFSLRTEDRFVMTFRAKRLTFYGSNEFKNKGVEIMASPIKMDLDLEN